MKTVSLAPRDISDLRFALIDRIHDANENVRCYRNSSLSSAELNEAENEVVRLNDLLQRLYALDW